MGNTIRSSSCQVNDSELVICSETKLASRDHNSTTSTKGATGRSSKRSRTKSTRRSSSPARRNREPSTSSRDNHVAHYSLDSHHKVRRNVPMKPDDTKKETDFGSCTEQQYMYAASSMKGLRPSMEDAHLICTAIPVMGYKEPLQNHSIFGVFDGHGGTFTATFISQNFIDLFSQREELVAYRALNDNNSNLYRHGMGSRNNPQSDVNGIKLLKTAICRTFLQLDDILLPKQRGKNMNLITDRIEQIANNEGTPTNGMPITEGNSVTKLLDDRNHQSMSPENTMNDNEILEIANSLILSMERSGSTAVIVLVTPTHIICANTGDSRAILRRFSTVIPLSFDHKPTSIIERLRIENAGGYIQKRRIDGDLAVSRSFGDFIHKKNSKLSKNKQKVIVSPEISVMTRSYHQHHPSFRNNSIISNNNNPTNDEFIVIACDGIWDVMSNAECSDVIHQMLSTEAPRVTSDFLGKVCEEIINLCFKRNSRDNMTIMIIAFTNNSLMTSSSSSNVRTNHHNYFFPSTKMSSLMVCHQDTSGIMNCTRCEENYGEYKSGNNNPRSETTENPILHTSQESPSSASNTTTMNLSSLPWLKPFYYNKPGFADSQRILNWF